jgi:hypothetical protein
MPFPPMYDNTWSNTSPPDTQLANQLGADLRAFRLDASERMQMIGTFAARPSNLESVFGGGAIGFLYIAYDTSQIFQWGGGSWNDVTKSFFQGITPFLAAQITFGSENPTSSATLLSYTPTNSRQHRATVHAVPTTPVAASTIIFTLNYTEFSTLVTPTTLFFNFGLGLPTNSFLDCSSIANRFVSSLAFVPLSGNPVTIVMSFTGAVGATPVVACSATIEQL